MFFAAVRRALVVAVSTATGLALTLAGAEAAHAAPVYYQFVAEHSGKCLDIRDGSTRHAAPAHQWQCLDGVRSQQWEARRLDDGAYAFVNRRSGRCLDVYNASSGDNVTVVQATCYFRDNQRWRLKKNSDGSYRIIAKHSGKCLDVAWAEHADGARVVQSRCWGGDNQKWQLTSVA
jgi:hypothetical protein